MVCSHTHTPMNSPASAVIDVSNLKGEIRGEFFNRSRLQTMKSVSTMMGNEGEPSRCCRAKGFLTDLSIASDESEISRKSPGNHKSISEHVAAFPHIPRQICRRPVYSQITRTSKIQSSSSFIKREEETQQDLAATRSFDFSTCTRCSHGEARRGSGPEVQRGTDNIAMRGLASAVRN